MLRIRLRTYMPVGNLVCVKRVRENQGRVSERFWEEEGQERIPTAVLGLRPEYLSPAFNALQTHVIRSETRFSARLSGRMV